LHEKFRLVLFASFLSDKDAIALEMLEQLKSLVYKNGSKNFELHLRFSDRKSKRWDEQFLKE
jgi:hypothetical protein